MSVASPCRFARHAVQGLATVGACAFATVVMAHADALRAAGVTGEAPANAGAIKEFVSTITDNALWLIGTVAVLAILVIGGLFFFGHSRAADYASKIAIGAVVIVSAPGIAA
jgi:hypothetical protein